MKYFENHSHLLEHYVEGSYGGWYLAFLEGWRQNLPDNGIHDGLHITLQDTTDNKLYDSKIYSAYEPTYYQIVLDKQYNVVHIGTLMHYFYGSHHCACHRKTDAQLAGAITDDECEGRRFLIERITPLNSNLILVSETYSLEELEEMVKHE